MKKQFTFLSAMALSFSAFCQTAITINASDMPVPTAPYNVASITAVNASLGNNQAWDYSAYPSSNPTQNEYIAEGDPFFTSAGVDVYLNSTKALSSSKYYEVAHEFDFNANAVKQNGFYVYPQSYSLGTTTGNNNDSLIFPQQGYILANSRTVFPFPFTANSAWRSTTRYSVDFALTVASYGLNNTPAKHVFYLVQEDSIVGWGTLRVYTPSGASIPYEVLMGRRGSYSVDSFYVGGAPAPAPLLTAFTVTQGQITGANYGYNFYRKGSFNYLMRLYYGTDNTFTSLQQAFIHTDDITAAVGTENPNSYSTFLYPNPTNGSLLNVQVLGKNVQLTHYVVLDMMGRTVQTGTPQTNGSGSVSILLAENLANGKYVIKVQDSENQEVVTEKFDLTR